LRRNAQNRKNCPGKHDSNSQKGAFLSARPLDAISPAKTAPGLHSRRVASFLNSPHRSPIREAPPSPCRLSFGSIPFAFADGESLSSALRAKTEQMADGRWQISV
jgi:hypothetical protein